jgi:hypothetical protein
VSFSYAAPADVNVTLGLPAGVVVRARD